LQSYKWVNYLKEQLLVFKMINNRIFGNTCNCLRTAEDVRKFRAQTPFLGSLSEVIWGLQRY